MPSVSDMPLVHRRKKRQLTLALLAQFSWTKLEAEVSHENVSPFASTDATAPKDIPRLTILSLSSRTVVHLKENKREIVCAAARVWHDGVSLSIRSRSEEHSLTTNVCSRR